MVLFRFVQNLIVVSLGRRGAFPLLFGSEFRHPALQHWSEMANQSLKATKTTAICLFEAF